MKNPDLKKLLILNLPYLFFVFLFGKVGQAVRLTPGADMSEKVLHIGQGFSAAFETPCRVFTRWIYSLALSARW